MSTLGNVEESLLKCITLHFFLLTNWLLLAFRLCLSIHHTGVVSGYVGCVLVCFRSGGR